jgi:hypothetical protein
VSARPHEAFSTWLRASGRKLPAELAGMVPPEGLTYVDTVRWLVGAAAPGVRNPATLVASLESALRAIADEWSAETCMPLVVAVELLPMPRDRERALSGHLFGGTP